MCEWITSGIVHVLLNKKTQNKWYVFRRKGIMIYNLIVRNYYHIMEYPKVFDYCFVFG